MVKIIEENGKYYRVFSDGRIEITLEELKNDKEKSKLFKSYLQHNINHLVGNRFAIDKVPKILHELVQIDLDIDFKKKELLKILEEKPTEKAKLNLITSIEHCILLAKGRIARPLQKHNVELNKYHISKLNILQNEIKLHRLENVAPQPTKTESNATKKIILEYFEAMHKNGWEYAFRNEKDYNSFTEVLTYHFEQKEYSIPAKTIKLQKGCKTILAKTLKEIWIKLANVDKLKTDKKYLKLLKHLNHYKEVSDFELYKMLTR